MSDAPRDPSQIVAIVGMAGRFPGADTVEQYWSNLCQGIESISMFSAPELEAAGVPSELRSHPRYVGARAVLDEVESFDAGLFGFSPREAELMDPQLRIFLECAWEALERAGCDPERYGKPIGVYAGVSMNTYLIHQLMRNPGALQNAVHLRLLNDKDFLTTWLSYRLNLRGPSMAVQTACSTSLVAVHVACQSLLAFECDAALAGGVTVFVPQERGYLYDEGSIFSPDGRCRPFDAAARGTVGGNGAGLVLLKRLDDALADGDLIHALIRGTAINNDGSLKVSYTAPSVDSQAEVIAAAQSLADVEPDTLGFIETHGTGTALGDPIEIAALTRVFRESTERKGFCALGSVKANIGHLDQAAGVAGLIKASLAVEHGLIPPSLHFEAPNPEIDLAGSPFRIETRLAEWRSNGHPRRAGVSSFGIGGTNAHVVIEQPPHREPSGPSRERQLLLWSARTPTALDAMTRNLGDWLSAAADREPADRPALADVAWTCQVGRRELAYRRALVCSSLEDAAAALSGHQADRLLTGHPEQEGRSVAFLFPGQGSQYPDMGLELYRSEPVFREAVDRCCELLAPRLGFDLRRVLYPGLSGESPDPGRLAQTAVAQPALFTVEYALARLWMAWGIEPKAMIGHSLGEYVAACLAGVLSLDDALALVAVRGRLIQSLAPGAMLSVALPEAELAPRLGGRLSLAAVNGPRLCAVSGPEEEVEALRRSLEELGIESRRLQTSHAFHSAMMDPILAAFTREVERVALRAPEIPFVSNLTGTWITDAEATDPGYWARHLRQAVRFADGAATLLRELDAALLEVGPGRTLATFVRAQAEGSPVVATSLRHARDTAPDLDHLLAALGRLWLAGVRVDWQGFHAGETRRREILPTYPFDRRRYWVDAAGETAPAVVVAEPAAEPVGYDRPAVTTAYEAPRDEVERAIAAIWTELLGIRDIGIHDDFFELGGHSLVATRVLSRMRDQLAVDLPLASLFEAPTVAKLRERIREPHLETGPAIAAPPIVPVPRDGALPLSFAQQRFWFLDHLEPGSSWYNLSWALRLDGELDGAALAASLGAIVDRHEALRTTFPEVDGQPVQRIAPPRPVPLPVVDLSLLPPGPRDSELARRIAEDSARPFDLARGPVLRTTLVRLSGGEHVLIFTIHHIAADGWSIGVLVGELTALYSGLVSGARPVLPLLPVQYADHAAWQRSWLQGEVLDRLVEAWRARLAGANMALDLPSDRPRPTVPSFQGESLRVEMAPRTVEGLRALSRGHGATLFMVLLAAVQTLLHRLSGQEDLIVGSPVAGRGRPEIERLIGAFVNTLALRGDLTGGPSFRTVLGRARETALEAYALQDLPFEKLVEALQPERDLSRAPLFQTMLVLQNAPFSRCALPGLELRSLPVESRTSRFDLLLSLAAAGDQVAGTCEIATDLFDRSTVQRWLAYLEALIAGAAEQPDLPVAALPMVSEAEQAQLLREWNDTELGIRHEATLHELFEAQVERTPAAPALSFRGRTLTYRELDARADRLAHRLRHLGVGPEVIVGVFCERSPEMVVALLAILKAGGAYLPLSPEQPEERLSLLVGETAAPVLLTQERLAYRLPAYGGIRIFVDHDAPGEPSEPAPAGGASAGNLAYVIYTSGSTGRPKGVAIEHRSAAALVAWATEVFPAEDLAGVLASTAIYFDLSVFELFVTLSRGGRVFLVENVLELATLDTGGALTLVNTVPSGIAEVLRLEALPASVRTVNLAGEPLKSPLVRQLHGLGSVRRVFNLYGPSEDTTYSTFARIDPEDGHPPIGVPVADTRVRLLDRGLSQVPVGAVGEIYLSGAGLARGYFGQPGLTAERFVPDPFSVRPGDRMYRTGDLARYRTSGLLDYLGRVDHQVKLRGFRIELGEIESVLQRHPRVRETVVVVRRDREDDPRLAAYVVPSPAADRAVPEAALVDELRQHLQDRLPSYMIPAAFVLLEALPLTPNGKIDRKALLALGEDRTAPAAAAHQPPCSELEIRMADVWKELLGLDRIGRHDRLFDLGAHSLLMVRAHVKLRDLVGDRLTLVDLFKYPTIASLASFLDAAPGQETLQLQRGRERSESRSAALGAASRDVAVVGLRGRFSQAKDLDSFWQNLCDGVEAISFFSDEELLARGVGPSRLQDPTYVKAGGVLEGFDRFDASFFGYSPREAEIMDPQQRLFLECSWEALEDAGYDPGRYPGAVGVFAGTSMSWYLLNLFSNPDLLASQGLYQAMIGNDKDFLPTRVSYKLNLRGPSVNIQSACSTSLVAVHFACQSLLNGECDMALAGGVSASAVQGVGYTHAEGGIFSPDGHCRAFDAGARGTVSGSGLAVVVLKRLADAVADGDTIRAVIKGSAINNDGSFKVGYTAPSVEGQANAIAEAQAIAGVDPETITYVEAHGTGTEVGDPIEIQALTAAWRQKTDRKGFCAIGSVKTNLGHLDAAAGVTGLVKTVLALEAKKIPPSLHFEQPNPKLDLENSPFYVSDRLADWVSEDGPRRAGVSSFGLGGTNAHVVLEEAPERAPSSPSRPLQLLVLSTRAAQGIEAATDNLAEHLRRHPGVPLADMAYTLQVGRAELDHRRILVCRDREDAVQALETRDPQRLLTLVREPVDRRVTFLFPGGGAQHADMGLELYREEPVFREVVDRCLELAAPHVGLDLKPYLYPSLVEGAPGGALSRTSTALPALFITEIALAELWMSWGIRPQALIGHSLGEYAAAYLAGVLSLEDALALVALRGRLFEKLPQGAMLSVPLPEAEVLPLLGESLSIAAINDATQCVVSGPVEEIARLEQSLTARGLEVHKLHIEVAAHSVLVEPILAEFGDFLRGIDLQAPRIPFVSNVTGTWIRDEEATDPAYWVRQLRQTVRFAAGLDALLEAPHQVLLEMGPGRVLSSFVRRHARKTAGHEIFTTLRHVKDSVSDQELTLNLLGRLWLLGQEIDWAGFHAGERRHRVPLPTYPFDRQRFWVERRIDAAAAALSRRRAVKKPDVADWFYAPSWRLAAWPSASAADEPGAWLLFADHCGLGRELADALASQGHRVVTVVEGAAFVRIEDGAYVVDPAQSADYDALLRDLQRRGGIPRRIVHLWSVTANDSAAVADRFDRDLDRGFYSLLRLAQALLRHNVTADVQLDVVSNGLQRVDGGDAVCPEKAALLGVCQVLPQEYDCFSCRSIDVVLQSGRRTELASRLAAEISQPARERAIAYRGRRRWVRSFEPVRVEAPAAGTAPALRERGVYLITGGLGRFGLSYARHLADTVGARLILTGRSGLPLRDAWPQWLDAHGDGDPVSRKIRQIEDLERRGAEVVTLSADVADEAQMRAVVELARERFGGLHGVIHAAGIIGPETFRAIPETGVREAEAHFRPKLRGAAVLARVLEGVEPDFCLMISSISTVLGGLGFAAYSAANLALDAFAQERDLAGGFPWMSVGWDAWAEREGEAPAGPVGAELVELAMSPREGLDVFARCLSLLGVPQLTVSTGDLEARARRWTKQAADADAAAPAAEPAALHDRPNLPQPYVAPRDATERTVAGLWQGLLGIEQIGVHDNFFELGGDSLRATQLASSLRRTFGVSLPLRTLFDAPTVAGQALAVENLQAERTMEDPPALSAIERGGQNIFDQLAELDGLSDEGIEALLDEDLAMYGGIE